MKSKKNKTKMKTTKIIIFLVIVIIALGILVFKKQAITGKVVAGKETAYSENLNIIKNESGTYEWKVKNSGNIKSLKATGAVSSGGSARVFIEKNGTKYVLFDSTKQLFDVNIKVLQEYKNVFQGDEILIQNQLLNLRGFGSGNVDVKYSIKDSKGNLIATEKETVFVETQAKFIRKLVIPADIKPGTYVAFVEASANGTTVGTGSDTFEIKAKYEEKYTKQLKYGIIGVVVVILVLIAFIVGIHLFRRLKKKKEITEIKEKAPLEKMEKLEKELKSLEEAHESGLISEESYRKEKSRIESKLGAGKK